MATKKEERQKRRAEKDARFEASKVALLAKVNIDPLPKVEVATQPERPIRLAPHLEREILAAAARQPEVIVDGSRYSARMTFCDTKSDVGAWTWGELRAWEPPEWHQEINPAMTELSKLTWGEIDALASGAGHKMHHGHEITDLIEEAQLRWMEVDLEQFDSVFRFRICGQRKRAWGYIVQAHFHVVWWDREHTLYTVADP